MTLHNWGQLSIGTKLDAKGRRRGVALNPSWRSPQIAAILSDSASRGITTARSR
jgi:hypothetical protein